MCSWTGQTTLLRIAQLVPRYLLSLIDGRQPSEPSSRMRPCPLTALPGTAVQQRLELGELAELSEACSSMVGLAGKARNEATQRNVQSHSLGSAFAQIATSSSSGLRPGSHTMPTWLESTWQCLRATKRFSRIWKHMLPAVCACSDVKHAERSLGATLRLGLSMPI